MSPQNTKSNNLNNSVNNLEQKLWSAADKLRNNMDAAEYKHIVLGLIFLKYISDAFKNRFDHLSLEVKEGADPEDPDEYRAKNIFWVPKEARWSFLQDNAKKPVIGSYLDNAMDAIERDNPQLKGILPKDYGRPSLDSHRLGELIDLIGTIGLYEKDAGSKDLLGQVYEYFLGQFADAEGKKGGQFYTARCIVALLVEMIEPFRGRIYDPCCGSGGMFVQSEKFVISHQGKIGDIAVYGQESNQTTWRLCNMNLAIRGIDCVIKWGNSFTNDLHKDLKADFILANPPFNDSDWAGERLREDIRWKYGIPPTGNANFAWVSHFIYHLCPTGIAGFVLANGSMSSNTSNEGIIRKNIIEDDLIDCMISLPGQLFYNTSIPVCLWFVTRDKKNNKFRNRQGSTLFIDARNMGTMMDRRHKVLTDEEIAKISSTYHAWRGEGGEYKDIPGFCKSATLEDIKQNDYILTPGRYVGFEEVKEDDEVFEAKMEKLTKELSDQLKKSSELDEEIRKNLKSIGFEI